MAVFNVTTNLCYLLDGRGRVLLQFKRKGFGAGKWNGPGGKIKDCESSLTAVIREVSEETGLTVVAPEKMGEMEFIFLGKGDWNQVVHVYLAKNFSGELKESEEGELKWFEIDKLPFKDMWEDDPYWLPEVLAGGKVKKRFYFDSEGKLQSQENL